MKLALAPGAVVLAALLASAPALAQTTAAPPPPTLAPGPAPAPPASTAETQAAEVKLREVITQLHAGAADFDKMTPQLKTMLQPRAEEVKHILDTLGDLNTVSLLGVDPDDHVIFFRVIFKNGATDWAIKVNAEGKLEALALRPAQS